MFLKKGLHAMQSGKVLSIIFALGIAVACFGVFVSSVSAAPPHSSQPQSGIGWYAFHNQLNGNFCLGVSGARTIIWSCNGNNDQSWMMNLAGTDGSGTYYTIVNQQSGQCLTMSTTNWGATPTTNSCNTRNTNQQWYMSSEPVYWGDTSTLINKQSHLCLGVNQGNIFSGALPVQWGCNGNSDQQWFN